eukprot:COSAG06_NODE_63093_length_263_cov_0.634146_1_plen_87_part_11
MAGYVDVDSDPSTPCDSDDVHRCLAGFYAPEGSSGALATACTICPIGTADLDANPATVCEDCRAGHEALAVGATSCSACREGRYDDD